jgi:multidrug transporter EmrE-like cation transporter
MIDALCIALVAAMWGGWPLVARSSGYGGPVGSLLLTFAGLVPIGLATLLQGATALPSTSACGRIAVAGAMMGAGLVAFNIVVNGSLDASVSIPIVDAGALIVSTAGAIYFFGEALSPQKIIGIFLLVAGIVVLRPS